MAWEVDSEKQVPCPCGQSTYTSIHRSDDWNRHETSYTMNCEACKETHELWFLPATGYDRMRTKGWHRWITRAQGDHIRRLKREAQDLEEQVRLEAHARHLSALVEFVRVGRNRKGMHARLLEALAGDHGHHQLPSFYRFDTDVRNEGLEAAVADAFPVRVIPIVLGNLGREDTDLVELLRRSDAAASEVKSFEHELLKVPWHG